MFSLETMLAPIRADRNDWGGWLVLADWLTERGDVRGEMVILAHRAATGGGTILEKEELRARIAMLEAEHREVWLDGLRVPEGVQLDWHHGFVFGVLAAYGDETPAFLDALAAHPVGCMLERLQIRKQPVGSEGAAALARTEAIGRLRRLDLSSAGIGDAGLAVLLDSGRLQQLEELSLGDDGIGVAGAEALAAAALPRLRWLDLRDNDLRADGTAALAQATFPDTLYKLHLGGNAIGTLGIEAVCGNRSLAGLKRLVVAGGAIGDAGAAALADAAPLSSLVALDVGGNGIGPQGARALANSAHLRSLTELSMGDNRLGPEGTAALANAAILARLIYLDLCNNGLGDEGAEALADTKVLRSADGVVAVRQRHRRSGRVVPRPLRSVAALRGGQVATPALCPAKDCAASRSGRDVPGRAAHRGSPRRPARPDRAPGGRSARATPARARGCAGIDRATGTGALRRRPADAGDDPTSRRFADRRGECRSRAAGRSRSGCARSPTARSRRSATYATR